ncbi:MAG TPA: acyl-CoA dehydrogenase family protein [Mycobacteriales bacterium]|jgi:alkylation response protein AidB-like acyl-CoA dehydrogenase|nr:acyl-CoA dehydrogenase family protein [Mycobacteriales bacterium]
MDSAERDRVTDAIRRLLDESPPGQMSAEDFWGAQFDAGLAWVQFPEGRGGLGVDPRLQSIVDDELRALGAPTNVFRNFMGVGMAGPTLVTWASEELQERLLRPLFRCDEIWCQLFSEPGAGSDVASLSTSAVRDGDEWVVNGQKVWTTLAHIARWGLLLARTDPDAAKHEGLTYFVIDMTAPGVEVRPLRQITGEAEFNEVYFTDVRIPDSRRVGPVGNGWTVALTTLMNERLALSGLSVTERGGGPIRQAVRLWQEREPVDRDPVLRDELLKLWAETEVVRLTSMRARENLERGIPGPENSTTKLAMALNQQHIWELALRLAGPAGLLTGTYEMVQPTAMGGDAGALGERDDVDIARCYLVTRGTSIGGGTTDIMRNILGERVLRLPPEPRADKDQPWKRQPR